MKKPSLIIGKKQIILSCLTLMLAIAVYVNYAMSDGKLKTAEVKQENGITYGDTAFVNAQAEAEKETDAGSSDTAEDSAASVSVAELSDEQVIEAGINCNCYGEPGRLFCTGSSGTNCKPG